MVMTVFQVNVVFAGPLSGKVSAVNGTLASESSFQEKSRITLSFSEAKLAAGPFATVATIHRNDGKTGFSFFLRDVTSKCPIWLPYAEAAVLPADDDRDYAAVAAAVKAKGLLNDADQLNKMPEWSAEQAFKTTRKPAPCPAWLGLGRDPRIFEIGPSVLTLNEGCDSQFWGHVSPRDHEKYVYRDKNNSPCNLTFSLGPGAHCAPKLTRRLMDGWMPILTSVQDEKTIRYELTAFVSREEGPITPDNVGGADLDTAYTLGMGRMDLTEEQHKEVIRNWRENDKPVPICILRIKAINTVSTPAYAWFKSPEMQTQGVDPEILGHPGEMVGGIYECMELHPGKSLLLCRMNGEPLPNPEVSVLVQPGETFIFDIIIPHHPISRERAEKLMSLDVDAHLAAARAHWQRLAASAASFSIPETAIDERAKAGLQHLEILTTGPANDTEPLLANAGQYTPIGTESSPIIQFFDSVGWHDKARRCIEFFLLHRQKPNGYIQCYFDYQSETGPVLWTAGEHFRYTHDLEWLRKMTPILKLSCEFLLDWRNRNKTEEARAVGGWGLASGKVADPPDFFHSFFLNSGNFIGLARMAEVLVNTDPEYAAWLSKEVDEYRQDLRNAINYSIEHSPVIPLEDGSWTASIPAWTEQHGATVLYADGGKWFTHGDFAGRDLLTGPLWLGISEVVPYDSPEMDAILRYNQHPQTVLNAALSQPYYCRHDIAHIARNEIKLFLHTFYNQIAAIQDRETYTIWEHYYLLSIHKTHEEAWFLMQLRWLLWFEPDVDSLRFLAGVPSHWFRKGQPITVKNACGYCGKFSYRADTGDDSISFSWEIERMVKRLEVRLPIPEGKVFRGVSAGSYDPATSLLTLPAHPYGLVTLTFADKN